MYLYIYIYTYVCVNACMQAGKHAYIDRLSSTIVLPVCSDLKLLSSRGLAMYPRAATMQKEVRLQYWDLYGLIRLE